MEMMAVHRFCRLTGGLLCGLLFVVCQPAAALEIQFKPVAPGVFAFIGETGPRTAQNEGLNANLGLIETSQGAILIDSGATVQTAARIQQAARLVTPQPIRWVINTGGQDHRWLGNAHFASQGVEIIAHESARADMQARAGDHLTALAATLGDRAAGTRPHFPGRWISGPDATLELGGVTLRLLHRGGGHTPGDMMVALPLRKLVFAGDVVYVDRLLGVIPVSSTKAWLAAFDALEVLDPGLIVPGHGQVTTLAVARLQTRNYLRALRQHMKQAVDDGTDISAAVRSFDGAAWASLPNATELMPGNASRTYLEMERE